MSEWVECKQELPPEEGEPLLIVWKGVVQYITYTLNEGGWYPYHVDPDECSAIEDGLVSVTHWMPLPAPPASATHTAIANSENIGKVS